MQERLEVLEKNIAVLHSFRNKYSLQEVEKTKNLEWTLRYGLLVSIQVVIDISCHLVSDYNVGAPETYGECIELLKGNGYIDTSLAEKLCGMVGLRNLLIHEYAHIKIEKLYELLNK